MIPMFEICFVVLRSEISQIEVNSMGDDENNDKI